MKKYLVAVLIILGIVWLYAIQVRASDSGALSPGTMADDATVGTVAWFSENSAKVSDNGYAGAVSGLEAGATMHYLKATNFGFSVPTGATIDGILVEIEQRYFTIAASVVENSVRIVKAGTIGTTDKSTGATLPTVDTYVSYGANNDLWDETWTAEDINDSTSGVVFSVRNPNPDLSIPYVDHIRATVYYTESGGAPAAQTMVSPVITFE